MLVVLYFSADARKAGSQDFYATTVEKLREQDAQRAMADQQITERLKDAEEVVEKVANEALPKKPDLLHPGRKKAADGQAVVAEGKGDAGPEGPTKEIKAETTEEHEVEVELGSILKRSPIIVFSKSYCPYSRKAKTILLDKYSIVPAPFVVELDQHPLGSQLQAELHRTTGRRTVPNVLISGKSIGGGDDVAELDRENELIDTVRKMGGKRIMEAKLRDA